MQILANATAITRFKNKIAEFFDQSKESQILEVVPVADLEQEQTIILQNPSYIMKESELYLSDDVQCVHISIPLDNVLGVSNSVFADSMSCTICCSRGIKDGYILSARC